MTVKQPSVTKDLGRKYTSIFRCYKIVGETIGRPLVAKGYILAFPLGKVDREVVTEARRMRYFAFGFR